MNIVHIIPSMNTGGAERMLSHLLGYQTHNKQTLILLLDEEIKYKLPVGIDVITFNFKKNIKSIMEIKKLYKTLNKLKPDIIQTWMNHSNLLGLYYKKYINRQVRLIWNIRHSIPTNLSKFSLRSLLLNLLKRNSSSLDGIIYVSNESMQKHKAINFTNNNSIVIPNGFQINKTKLVSPNNTKPFVIGHVGRYSAVKNQKIIIEAFNILCSKNYNVTLKMIGRGLTKENEELVQDINKKYRDKVYLLGEKKDLAPYYQQMDVFVLSSYSEGFPNVLGESMVNGTPVITTNAGDSYEIVGDTGFKMTTYGTDELVSIVEGIITEPENLIDLGNNAKKRVTEHFEIGRVTADYFNFYHDILKNQ